MSHLFSNMRKEFLLYKKTYPEKLLKQLTELEQFLKCSLYFLPC